MEKDSFVFYSQWREQINMLTDSQAGALIKALCEYVACGEIVKLDALTNMLFSIIKSQIDRDTAKYEETCQKRREAGQKGGRPKTENQKVFEESKKTKRLFEKAKKADNDNVNVNVNEYEYVNGNDSVCSAGAHTREDTHTTEIIVVGKYSNVRVPANWLKDFKARYTYADDVIESLSRYKETKGIVNENDIPYLERFAEADRDKYSKTTIGAKNSASWKDESLTDEYWEEFFKSALLENKKNNSTA